MKAYTDLGQSKKLAEVLPLESADMEYMFLKKDNSMVSIVPFVKDGTEEPDCPYTLIPCWSLSALLGLMPKLYEFENNPDDGGCQPNLCKAWDLNKWHIVYRPSLYFTEWYEEPLDAAFEMVCWLKENGKI